MENIVPKLEVICFHNGVLTVAFFLRSDRPTTIGRAIENVIVFDDERCSRFTQRLKIVTANGAFMTLIAVTGRRSMRFKSKEALRYQLVQNSNWPRDAFG